MHIQFAPRTFNSFETIDFNIQDYSRLKFGSNNSAIIFGKELAEKFFDMYQRQLANVELVVIPAPYNSLEIASSLLARQFMSHLNILLSNKNYPIAHTTIMHRLNSYVCDYATMTIEERKELISGDKFFINKDFIAGKTLVFVDDITITGTHEKKVESFLSDEHIDNDAYFLYYAKYTGRNPEIESQINLSCVNDPDTFVQCIREPGHQIVVRTVKFMLTRNRAQLLSILSSCSVSFINEVYTACINKEYDKVPEYRDIFNVIRRYLKLVTYQ